MKKNIPAQPLLNRQQMAAELSTTTQVLDRLRRHGKIPHIVCGHFVRFDRDAVFAALQKYTVNANAE